MNTAEIDMSAAEQIARKERISDERLDELIGLTIGRDTLKALMELRDRRQSDGCVRDFLGQPIVSKGL